MAASANAHGQNKSEAVRQQRSDKKKKKEEQAAKKKKKKKRSGSRKKKEQDDIGLTAFLFFLFECSKYDTSTPGNEDHETGSCSAKKANGHKQCKSEAVTRTPLPCMRLVRI